MECIVTALTIRLGKRIREVRLDQNISQEQLADRAEISRAHMGRIERGDMSPTIDTVERIAAALLCAPHVLFLEESGQKSLPR